MAHFAATSSQPVGATACEEQAVLVHTNSSTDSLGICGLIRVLQHSNPWWLVDVVFQVYRCRQLRKPENPVCSTASTTGK